MSNNSSSAELNDGLQYILLFRLIVWGYVGIVLSLFGIVGNVITILVLTSPSMRTTSTNIYLTALSCSNIAFLLIFIPSYSIRYLLGYRLYISNQPPIAFEILLTRLPTTPVYNIILLSIIYLTVAVSMDRLILIKFPLKAKQILTQRTTLLTILSIYIFSIIYCIPYWLEQRYDPESKSCVLTNIGRKIKNYTRIYVYIPVVYLIPFITLTFINITIIQNLIANQERKKTLGAKTTKKKQADYYITLMLVAVIIVFVLCQLPLLVLNVWFAIDPSKASSSLVFRLLNSCGVLLIVFNTSTNFLLYCFFGQKFRQTLVELFFQCLPHHNKQTNLQTRLARLSNKPTIQTSSPLLRNEIKQVNSSIIAATTPSINTNEKRNSMPTNNHSNFISTEINSTNNEKDESIPLINDVEHFSTLDETSSMKFNSNFNLYTCASGKRILVLKI